MKVRKNARCPRIMLEPSVINPLFVNVSAKNLIGAIFVLLNALK